MNFKSLYNKLIEGDNFTDEELQYMHRRFTNIANETKDAGDIFKLAYQEAKIRADQVWSYMCHREFSKRLS